MMKNLNRSYKILEKKFCLKKIVVLKESIVNFKKMSRHKNALKSLNILCHFLDELLLEDLCYLNEFKSVFGDFKFEGKFSQTDFPLKEVDNTEHRSEKVQP